MGYDAFVSYSSKDRLVADPVVAALEAAGVRCWLAPRDIRAGQEWADAIIKGINACRVMVLVFSASANQSPQVKREVERAVSRGMAVVPFKIDAAAPSGSFEYYLMTPHWLDATQPPVGRHTAELVASVRALLATAPAADDAPGRTPGPSVVTAAAASRSGAGNRRSVAVAVLAVCMTVAAAGAGVWAWKGYDAIVIGSYGGGSPQPQATRPATSLDPPPAPVPVPPRLKGLAAEPVLRLVYESAPSPSAPAAERPRLVAGIAARRAGQTSFCALRDGDELASEADEYVVAARPLTAGYLYVFQVDAGGKVDWLFPRNDRSPYSAGSNPVAAGPTLQVPAAAAGKALFLDRTAGVEHVYFIFAAAPWPELERLLNTPPTTAPPSAVAAAALRGPSRGGGAGVSVVTEPNALGCRGVGGARATDVGPDFDLLIGQGAERVEVPAVGTRADAAGPLVVVERYFRHAGR